MTSTGALIISVVFLVNDVSLLSESEVGILRSSKYFSPNLVYLISNCILIKRLNCFPLKKTFHHVSCFLEIPVALLLLKASFYLWNGLHQYIIQHPAGSLVLLDWGICQPSEREECPETYAILVLKMLSFVILAVVINIVDIKSSVFILKAAPNDQQASVQPRPARRLDAPLSRSYAREMHRNRIERTASKRWRGSLRRLISAAVFNLSCFTHGCSTGWVSGVLGREALAGGAWLAALPCLVALPAAPFFAFLADAKGRKAGAFCISLSFILSWSLAAWCGPRGVWAARVAAGAGGAGALALAPLYCAEISPRTKGLAAMPALAASCGILFAFVAGGILSAHTLSLSMAAPPTVLLVSLVWLPETPCYLISIGRMQDAAKMICWLDGSDFREDLTDAIEQQEVMIRTEPTRRGSDALQPMLKRSRSEGTSEGEQSVCHELFRHRRSRRALISCCLLLTAAAGSGAGAVNSFAAAVLTHSGHAIPALNLTAYNFTVYNGTLSRGWREPSETGSVLCGTALVLGAAVATATVDRLGRKVLLLISCIGIAFCLTILGLYCDPRANMYSWYTNRLWPYKKHAIRERIHNFTIENIDKDALSDSARFDKINLENNSVEMAQISVKKEKSANSSIEDVKVEQEMYDNNSIWPPVVLLSMVVFLYNIGLGSVPYVLISELFSINVRSLASSLLISWMWLSSFFTLRYFGTLAIAVGLHGTYYIGACITLLISGYIYLMLPETKGKNQKEIDDLLNGQLLVHLKRKRKTNET